MPSSSPPGGRTPTRRNSESSLPPSSPLAPFSDEDDGLEDGDGVVDAEEDDDDAEGEDLFGETLNEYVSNRPPCRRRSLIGIPAQRLRTQRTAR